MLALVGTAESVDFGRRGCYCEPSCCSCYSYSYGCSYCHRCYTPAYYGCCGCYGSVYQRTGHYYGSTVPVAPTYAATTIPATIVVSLPAEARLTFDGRATESTEQRRTFVTPSLEPGRYLHLHPACRAGPCRKNHGRHQGRVCPRRHNLSVELDFSTTGCCHEAGNKRQKSPFPWRFRNRRGILLGWRMIVLRLWPQRLYQATSLSNWPRGPGYACKKRKWGKPSIGLPPK